MSVQFGQAYGKGMIGEVGPVGVVTLRLGFAALILLALSSSPPPTGRRALGLVLAWGTAIAGMNVIYVALQHLPLGVAATLQFLAGPFAVALLGSRRLVDLGWAMLAGLGVLVFHGPGGGSLSLPAVLLALASGVSMGAYLLLSKWAGAASRDPSLLAWAVVWAALLSLPMGAVAGQLPPLRPGTLAAGVTLAVLSAVVPYRLDLAALRRLPPRVVGVLVSLEPVAGALAGLALLGEHLTVRQWLAIGCITGASIGAVTTSRADGR